MRHLLLGLRASAAGSSRATQSARSLRHRAFGWPNAGIDPGAAGETRQIVSLARHLWLEAVEVGGRGRNLDAPAVVQLVRSSKAMGRSGNDQGLPWEAQRRCRCIPAKLLSAFCSLGGCTCRTRHVGCAVRCQKPCGKMSGVYSPGGPCQGAHPSRKVMSHGCQYSLQGNLRSFNGKYAGFQSSHPCGQRADKSDATQIDACSSPQTGPGTEACPGAGSEANPSAAQWSTP